MDNPDLPLDPEPPPAAMMGAVADGAPDPASQHDLAAGLQFTNLMATINQETSLESRASILALTELLIEHGVIRLDEIKERRTTVRAALRQQQEQYGVRVRFGTWGDKYAAQAETTVVDCEARYHLCKGACCRLRWHLTHQDLDEGIVRWDYSRPYLNAVRPSGYCTHADPATRHCTIYENRPTICRIYDCSHDGRIWVDFEARIPNPNL